jgi:hypothetical protein
MTNHRRSSEGPPPLNDLDVAFVSSTKPVRALRAAVKETKTNGNETDGSVGARSRTGPPGNCHVVTLVHWCTPWLSPNLPESSSQSLIDNERGESLISACATHLLRYVNYRANYCTGCGGLCERHSCSRRSPHIWSSAMSWVSSLRRAALAATALVLVASPLGPIVSVQASASDGGTREGDGASNHLSLRLCALR